MSIVLESRGNTTEQEVRDATGDWCSCRMGSKKMVHVGVVDLMNLKTGQKEFQNQPQKWLQMFCFVSTLPETNIAAIAPENRPGPKRKGSSPNHPFSGASR